MAVGDGSLPRLESEIVSETVTELDRARKWLATEQPSLATRTEQLDKLDLELDELLDVARRLAAAIAARPELWQDTSVLQMQAQLAQHREALVDRWVQAALALRLAGVRIRPEQRAASRSGTFRAVSTEGDVRDRTAQHDAPYTVTGRHVMVDDDQRQRLQARLSGQFPIVTREAQPYSPALGQAVRAELGELPATLDGEEAVRNELRLLVRATRPERQESWRSMPADAQVFLIAHLAARARRLQEPPAAPILLNLDVDRQVEALFNTLSRYTKEEAPGFVYGLARFHGARGESWLHDAQDQLTQLSANLEVRTEPGKANPERELAKLEGLLHEGASDEAVTEQLDAAVAAGVSRTDARMVRLCRDKLELLGKLGRFKALRKAIKEADETDEAPEKQAGPLPDWPYWPLVRGKRGAIIGGDPREESRARIAQAFDLASLTWEGIDQVRQVETLATQIRGGGIDLIVILQSFINHAMCGKIVDACRSAKVPFAAVERGYGVERVRLAIEHDIGKRVAEAGN